MGSKKTAIIGGASGVVLFTVLLSFGTIGEASYVVLLSLTALVVLAACAFPRLREIDLKSLKLSLEEQKTRLDDVEFSQQVAQARLPSRPGSYRFEDIQAERALTEYLPALRDLAEAYLNVHEEDWHTNVRRKNQYAVEMAAYVLNNGIPKASLAAQENEGLLMAFAATVYTQPEANDLSLIGQCYKRIERLHVRWRIVACLHKMLMLGMIPAVQRRVVEDILTRYEQGADKQLLMKIIRTREELQRVLGEQSPAAYPGGRADAPSESTEA